MASTLVGSDVEVAGMHTRDVGFTSMAQKTLDKGWSLTGLLIHYAEDFQINDAGYLGHAGETDIRGCARRTDIAADRDAGHRGQAQPGYQRWSTFDCGSRRTGARH